MHKLGIALLTATKTSDEYFADPELTIEELCIAQLLKYKDVATRINAIKEKFNLNDASNWRDDVHKAEREYQRRKQKKQKKRDGKKVEEKSNENKMETNDTDSDSVSMESNSG